MNGPHQFLFLLFLCTLLFGSMCWAHGWIFAKRRIAQRLHHLADEQRKFSNEQHSTAQRVFDVVVARKAAGGIKSTPVEQAAYHQAALAAYAAKAVEEGLRLASFELYGFSPSRSGLSPDERERIDQYKEEIRANASEGHR